MPSVILPFRLKLKAPFMSPFGAAKHLLVTPKSLSYQLNGKNLQRRIFTRPPAFFDNLHAGMSLHWR